MNYYRVGPSLRNLESMVKAELSRPPKFTFDNRSEMAKEMGFLYSRRWSLDEVWLPSDDLILPEARLKCKDDSFLPDYIFIGFDFCSEYLRGVVSKFEKHIRYVKVNDKGSCPEFREKRYAAAMFPFMSPFEQVYFEIMEPYVQSGQPFPHMSVRKGFVPSAPIFRVATSPWLMCTQEFVDEVMPHKVEGLVFVDHETNETLVPGG